MTNKFAEWKDELPKSIVRADPVLVDITNVSNWVAMLPDEEWSMSDLTINLPWEYTWFEWRNPDTAVMPGGAIRRGISMGATTGVFTMYSKEEDCNYYFVFTDGLRLTVDPEWPLLLGYATVNVSSPGAPEIHTSDNHTKRLLGLGMSEQFILDSFFTEMYNVLYATTFAHCRNVTYYEKNHPEKLRKRNEKRGKIPQETYRILDIGGLQKQAKSEATESEGELKRALHICRGHFKTYTEENPLFGKVTGTFWVPMHKRGSEKHGKVKKDYRIKP